MERATNKRLTITGRYDGTCIVIEFHDNGCGIDEETRAALINYLNNQPSQNIKDDWRNVANKNAFGTIQTSF